MATLMVDNPNCPPWIREALRHRGARTRFWSTFCSYRSMWDRCYRPKVHGYKFYGGKGIKVCDRWHNWRNFIQDMGERPKDHCIGRKNHDLDYTPDNCFWEHWDQVRKTERKKRIIFSDGRNVNEVVKATGLSRTCILKRFHLGQVVDAPRKYKTDPDLRGIKSFQRQRIARGWPLERALAVEPRSSKKSGITTEQFKSAMAAGVSPALLRYRMLVRGKTFEDAIKIPVKRYLPFADRGICHGSPVSQDRCGDTPPKGV